MDLYSRSITFSIYIYIWLYIYNGIVEITGMTKSQMLVMGWCDLWSKLGGPHSKEPYPSISKEEKCMVCTYLKYLKRDNQASGKMYESGLWKVIYHTYAIIYIYTYMYVYIYIYIYVQYVCISTIVGNHSYFQPSFWHPLLQHRWKTKSSVLVRRQRHAARGENHPEVAVEVGRSRRQKGWTWWRLGEPHYVSICGFPSMGGTWWFIPRIVSGL